jgi:hypothetical protein
MWTIDPTPEWGRRLKFYEKKRARELIAALDLKTHAQKKGSH